MPGFSRFQEISPAALKRLFPLARVDDVLAGFYVAEDGRADPVGVTMALARGGRMGGARIIEGVAVTDALKTRGRVAGVRTNFGEIQAEYVVNCAGMWARQLGQQVGEAPELKNYFLAAGLNSIGIRTGGGVERVLATWTGFRFWRFSMHTA